jgi:hypothetical protein
MIDGSLRSLMMNRPHGLVFLLLPLRRFADAEENIAAILMLGAIVVPGEFHGDREGKAWALSRAIRGADDCVSAA